MATLFKILGIDTPNLNDDETDKKDTLLNALKRIQVDPIEQLFNINDNTPLIFPEEITQQLTHVINMTNQSKDKPKDLFIVRPFIQSFQSPHSNEDRDKKITPESLALTDLFYKQLI